MKTIALASAKGGTGKSSLAVNLADGFAREGKRVLLVDLDSQGSATRWLLGDVPAGGGVGEALRSGGKLGPDAVRSLESGLQVLPADRALHGLDAALAGDVGAHAVVRSLLAPLARRFDLVVLDTAPGTGLASVAGIVAADGVLIPVLPGLLGLAGVGETRGAVGRIAAAYRVRCRVLGVVLFAVDGRESVGAETRAALEAELGELVLTSEVRVAAAAKMLPARKVTSWAPGADSRGLEDYQALLEEVAERVG